MIQRIDPTRSTAPSAGRLGRLLAVLVVAGALGACSVSAGGLSAYQADSSHGCRPGPTKTVCPR